MKNTIWSKIVKHWQILAFIIAAVGSVFTFYAWRTEAADAVKQVAVVQEKVVQFEETFANIAQISKDLQDPDLWLRNYLINHGIDTLRARTWSQYPKSPAKDSAGVPLANIPFLDSHFLPERGIYKMIRVDGTEDTLSTLWNFIIKE